MIILLIVMTGLMAGIYFAFSVFIMKSLAELPAIQAAEAMTKINDVIVNTLFLPVFFGSTFWYAGLIVWSLADWQPESSLLVAAALVYIFGMFIVTAFGNVPLNNKLQRIEANKAALTAFWNDYLHSWTHLNHIRTLSCIAACTILTMSQV